MWFEFANSQRRLFRSRKSALNTELYKEALEIVVKGDRLQVILLYGYANKSRLRSSTNLLLASIVFESYLFKPIDAFDNGMRRLMGGILLHSLEEALSVSQLVTFSKDQYHDLLFLLISSALSIRCFLWFVSNCFPLDCTMLTL